MTRIELTKFEAEWITRRLAGELATYTAHAIRSNLFPKEEVERRKLKRFFLKLTNSKDVKP